MRILVIQHDPDKGLGILEDPLRATGAELDVRFAGTDPVSLDGHDALIALPGIANPPDPTEAVAVTRASLAGALEGGVPVLGICLGAELLAEAAGARSFACRAEYGYHPVTLTEEGSADALLNGLPAIFEAFQAHGYAAELPDGAVALARSAHALQAFRIKDRAWGLQFHPEPTEHMINTWLDTIGDAWERQGVRLKEVSAQAGRDVPAWLPLAAGIAQRFVRIARSVRQ